MVRLSGLHLIVIGLATLKPDSISMTKRQRRVYIREIFKYVKTDSVLILDHNGQLMRLVCHFIIVVIVDTI